MVALAQADRDLCYRLFVQELNAAAGSEGFAITKADLKAAIAAADDWADSNAASFNTALPQPAKASLSARQKARVLMYVLRRRYEVT